MTLRRSITFVALLVLVLGLALWLARMRIATAIVDRKLAAAGVPASYRITRIGPFLERMEDVKIGDPARPDLVARRIDVTIGYGFTGPQVTGVSVDGVRLKATLDNAGLHMGAIDKLLPKSSGGATKLPDMAVSLSDGRVALLTPNGAVQVQLAGSGNPARSFRGQAVVEAPGLRLASCALRQTRATLVVAAEGGKPQVSGPIAIGATDCPTLRLGQGTMRVSASSNATFETVALTALLDGFGGTAGPVRFAALHGPVKASGVLGKLAIQAQIAADHFGAPGVAARVASVAVPASLPVSPTAQRAIKALAHLTADAQAEATLDADIVGTHIGVHVHNATLFAANGARLDAAERGGMTWSPTAWRADGDVTLGGGDLPTATLQLRQAAAGAALSGTGKVAPYRAGNAALAIPTLTFTRTGTTTRFETQALIDGPIGDGAVQGLDVPLKGRITDAGAVVLGEGCQPLGLQSLRLIGFTFGPARTTLCGQPILARPANGTLRFDATSGAIHLAGRSASGVPVTLDTPRLHLTERGFETGTFAASVGESHVQLAALDGHFTPQIGGSYTGANGAIANVRLLLSEGDGAWTFVGGTLTLAGKLRVADAAPVPRFLPLLTDDMRLTLQGGVIDATATMREPKTRADIARVALTHRLANSVGHATLSVPGIVFAPKKLQPEALTPLTLGVIANVAGIVSGEGRIDWSTTGVTSGGSFGSDRLDLAAAFGPVSGIKGRIAFTDLLGLVSAPHQEVTIAEINPGVAVANGVAHFQLITGNRVAVEDATWPFAGGQLRLEPTTLDFGADVERHLTFRVDGLDAAAFIQQLDFPNLAATGKFDGVLPMIFDSKGGRIAGGDLTARKPGGTLAYVGELSSADIGTMGKLAFDALKAIRYSALEIRFDGRLDGEMISQVNFTGVREATAKQSFVARLIHNLPFRFNIRISAPFRGLVGSARAYMDPRLLLNNIAPTPAEPAIQPPASGPVR